VQSYWTGGAGIEITPSRQYTIGAVIEVFGTSARVTHETFFVTNDDEDVTHGRA